MDSQSFARFVLAISVVLSGPIAVADEGKVQSPEHSHSPHFSTVPLAPDRSEKNPLYDVFKKQNPIEDSGWDTEVMADDAKHQLKAIGKLLTSDPEGPLSPDVLVDLVSSQFRSGPLRPDLVEVFNDGALSVSRNHPAADGASPMDFSAATRGWRASFSKPKKAGDDSLRWKITGVDLTAGPGRFTTGVRLEVDGISPEGKRLSQVAALRCEWLASSPPKLAGWQIERFEETVVLGQNLPEGTTPFVDRTPGLMKHCDSFRDQLARGADYWYGNFDVAFGIQQGNQGISLCDINGDGLEDLFVCQPAGLPSRMYLRNEDGTLRDFTDEAGLSWLDDARSALFIDLDDDGDEDLALGLGYSLTLHENDGSGRFRLRVEIEMFSWPSSIAAADFDNDSDLDIYICGYTPRDDVAPGDIFANPMPYQDANNGARNFFIENKGPFEFADITDDCGLSQNNRRFSLAASWEDFDRDGDQDLYVANDFGRNNLYRNDLQKDGSRKFTDVAAEAGVEDVAAGMSVSWGDYNRDGLMDLYISNMYSSAGGRIAFQEKFQSTADEKVRAQLQRHARGNTLYQNQGDGTFKDVSLESGTTMGRWAWASHFVDLNNDSLEDLVVTNGFYTAEDTGDL